MEELESLRQEYEGQLASLKRELEEERLRRPPHDDSDQDPGGQRSPDGAGQEIPKVVPASQWPQFQSDFLQKLEELGGGLDETEREVLSRLQPQINQVHIKDLQQHQEVTDAELKLQVEAMKFTVSQVHSSQLQLVRAELASQQDSALQDQSKKLHEEYQQTLEVLQKEFEELVSQSELTPEELEIKVRDQLQKEFDSELEELKATLEAEQEVEMEEYKARLEADMEDFKRTVETQHEVELEMFKSKMEAEHEVEIEELKSHYETNQQEKTNISDEQLVILRQKLTEFSNLKETLAEFKGMHKASSREGSEEKLEVTCVVSEDDPAPSSKEASSNGQSPNLQSPWFEGDIPDAGSSVETGKKSMFTRLSFEEDECSGAGTSTPGYDVDLVQELQVEIESYKTQINDYKTETAEVHTAELESLRESLHQQFAQKMEHLANQHVKEMENLEFRLREQLLKPQGDESQQKQVQDLSLHVQTLTEEIEHYKITLAAKEEEIKVTKKEMADKHQSHIEKLMNDLSERHQTEVKRLSMGSTPGSEKETPDCSALAEKTTDMERKHKTEMEALHLELEDKYHQDLEELKSELQAKHFEETENLKNDLEREYDMKSALLKTDCQEVMQEREEALEARIEKEVLLVREEMEGVILHEVEAAKDAGRSEAEEHVDRMLRDMEQMQTAREGLETRLGELEESHAQDINALEQKFSEEYQLKERQLQEELETKLNTLREDCENSLRDEYEMRESKLKEELESFKENNKTMENNIKKEHETQLVLLKEESQTSLEKLKSEHEVKLSTLQQEFVKREEHLKQEVEEMSESDSGLATMAGEVEKFETEKAEFQKEKKKFAREQKDLNDKMAECEEKLRLQDEEIEEYKQSIEEYKVEFEQLNKMVQETNKEKQQLDIRLNDYENQVKNYEQQLQKYKLKDDTCEEIVDDEEKQELYKKLEEYTNLLASKDNELEDKLDIINEFEIDVEELRSQLEEAEQHAEYVKLQNSELEEQVEEYQASVEERDAMNRDYDERIKEYETNLASNNAEHEEKLHCLEEKYKKDTQFFESKITELREQLEQVQGHRSENTEDLTQKYENEAVNLQQQITDLENRFEQYKIDVTEGVAPEVMTLKDSLLASYEQELAQIRAVLKEQMDAVLEVIKAEFTRNQALFIEEHQKKMERLTIENEVLVAEMKEKHQQEVGVLRDSLESITENEALIKEMKEKHQQEITVLRDSLESEHQEHITSLQENHLAELEQLKSHMSANGKSEEDGPAESEWSEAERAEHQRAWETNQEREKEDLAKFEDDLADLKAHQLEQMENVSVSIKEDLLKENMASFEEISMKLETSHKADIEELKARYEEQIRTLEEKNQVLQMQSAQAAGTGQTYPGKDKPELVSGEHDEEFSVASSQEQGEFGLGTGSSQGLGSTLNQTLEDSLQLDLRTLHQRSLEELSLSHQQEVQRLTDEYEEQIDELNQTVLTFQKKVMASEETLQSELGRLRTELETHHSQELDNLRAELEENKTSEVHKLTQQVRDYEERILILKEKLESLSDDVDGEKKDSQSEKDNEIEKLQTELSEKVQEIVNMKQDFNEVRENDLAKLRQELELEKEEAIETVRKEYEETLEDFQRLKNELQRSLGGSGASEEEATVSPMSEQARSVESAGSLEMALDESLGSHGSARSRDTLTYQDSEEEEMEKADTETEKDLDEDRDSQGDSGKDQQSELDRMRAEISHLTEELDASVPKIELENLKEELEHYYSQNISELKGALNLKEEELVKVQNECEANLAKKFEEFASEMEEEKENELRDQRERLQTEISTLRQSLEMVMAEQERHDNTGEEVDNLKEQHFSEITAKMQLLEKLEAELATARQENDRYQSQVSELEERLEVQKAEYEVIFGRREREHEEGDNLKTMLQADLDRLQGERDATQQTNDHLLKILSENVKSNLQTEERINRCLRGLTSEGRRVSTPTQGQERGSGVGAERDYVPHGDGAQLPGPPHRVGHGEDETELHDLSALSLFSDEGLDLSQRISESLFAGPELDPDGEEMVTDSGQRVHQAVERLLDMITETTQQLLQARQIQQELLESLGQRENEVEALSGRCEETELRLTEEVESRQVLAVELNRTESLLQGYTSEKSVMDDSIRSLEDKKEVLIEELERTRIRLQELEESHQDLEAREEDLERQREALEQSIGREEQVVPQAPVVQRTVDHSSQNSPVAENGGLLQENSRLNEEKRDLQKAFEKEQQDFETRIRDLEMAYDDLQAENEKLQEEKKVESDDFKRQIEQLDKQLKSNKQFLEEMTVEREQERDEHQKETGQLQQALQEKERHESQESRLVREAVASSIMPGGHSDNTTCQEVQDLENEIREKSDSHGELILMKEQLERDLASQQLTATELRDTIKQLENDLEAKTRSELQLSERNKMLNDELQRIQEANLGLNQELKKRDSYGNVEDMQRAINDLESQLDTLKKSEQQEVQRRRELEEELKNLKTLEEELTADKEALQQQVCDQMRQMSTLKSQLDELKVGKGEAASSEHLAQLRERLEAEREAVQAKEKEISDLSDQLEQFREQLVDREEDLQQMSAQLTVRSQEAENEHHELQVKLQALEADNHKLKSEVSRLSEAVDSTPMPVLAQTLIDEKNQEIDHLNKQIDELTHQLEQPGKEVDNQIIEQLSSELESSNEELEAARQKVAELQTLVDNMRDSLPEQDMQDRQATVEEEGLKDQLAAVLSQTESLRDQLQQKDFDLVRAQEELDQNRRQEVQSLNEVLAEKENLIEQLSTQVETLQNEVENMTEFQNRFQEDYDMVQAMVETKQKEIENLSKELVEVRPQTDGITADMQAKYEDEISQLQQEVLLKQNVIEEREEELYTANERLDKQLEIEQELRGAKEVMARQRAEIHSLSRQLDQGSAGDHQPDSEALSHKIQEQEQAIRDLRLELSQSQTELRSRQEELNQAVSQLDTLNKALEEQQQTQFKELQVLRTSSASEVERLHAQLQSAQQHSQSSPEVKVFRERLEAEKRHSVEDVKRELQKRHADEINRLVLDHQREIQAIMLEMTGEDESLTTDTHRLRQNIENNERLDSRLFGHLGDTARTSLGASDRSLSFNGFMDDSDEMSRRLEAILRKVHEQGARVLSLSELQFLRGLGTYHPDLGRLQHAWEEEKHSLLSAVQSLKGLLAETQSTHDVNKREAGVDWRADILKAVHNVFVKEKEGLLTELHSYRVSHGDHVAPSVERLEQKVQEQEARHQSSLEMVLNADRQSMLSELRETRKQLNSARTLNQSESQQQTEQMEMLEEQANNRERQLRRQIELLEYKRTQEKVVAEDLRSSLEIEKSRTLELSSQLSREKSVSTELQNDIADTQAQLQKLKDTLDREQSRLLTASSALDEERKKSIRLNEVLASEQSASEQYIEQLESERFHNIQFKDRTLGAMETLKQELSLEKERSGEVTRTLEREYRAQASLRRELDIEKEQHKATEAKFKVKLSDLKTDLEMQKSRNDDLNSALQRERQLCGQLRETLAEERGSVQDLSFREKTTIGDLQGMLDLERSKILDMQTALERERHRVTALNSRLDSEKSQFTEELEREDKLCRQLKANIDVLQKQKAELTRELEFAGEKVGRLEADRERLQSSLLAAKDRCRELEGSQDRHKVAEKHLHRELEREKLEEQHEQLKHSTEITRLRQRLADLEMQLAECRRNEIQAREERDLERLKHAMSPARVQRHSEETSNQGVVRLPPRGSLVRRQLESLRQKIQLLVIRHQEELARSSGIENGRLSLESNPQLQTISRALKDLLHELQQIQLAIAADNQDDASLHSSVIPGLNNKILSQNSELTAFISKLSEEKHELRQTLAKLEEEVWNFRQKESAYSQAREAEDKLSTERHMWSQERATITLQLNESEKANLELKQTLRRTEIELEREREKYFVNTNVTQAAIDREKMQRLYGKYLRAESFRKGLVYQKKYLLLLLGGFQDCEEETLATIARMGAYPSPRDTQRWRGTRSPAYTKFRSAVRVVIAVSRLKFLVKKWRRATKIGTPVVAGSVTSHSGSSYIHPSNGFTPPRRERDLNASRDYAHSQPNFRGLDPYLTSRGQAYVRPGSMTTSPREWRGRDGKENRFPTSSGSSMNGWKSPASRRPILSALEPLQDPPPTPPSSLTGQGDNLSPSSDGPPPVDDSINDYIHRLETLQVRLGTVSQGARGQSSLVRR